MTLHPKLVSERACIGAVLTVAATLFAAGQLYGQVRVPHAVFTLEEWSMAGPYPSERVNRDQYPHFFTIFLAGWQPVRATNGFVDISTSMPRESEASGTVLARTVFTSDTRQDMTLFLESVGQLDLFVNGRKSLPATSDDRTAGTRPEKADHVDDTVEVRLERGLNEIFLMVTGRTGAWNFRVRADRRLQPKRMEHDAVSAAWATDSVFLTPETVVYDPGRDVLYVSNFDYQYAQKTAPSGYISKLATDGDILDQYWITGLEAPAGMGIWRDTLYVAEREHLVALDLGTGTVAGRWPIPDPVFPNDVAIDSAGTVYVSDTRTNDWDDSRVYRFRDGGFDVLANEGISRANGIAVVGNDLIVGSSGDGILKRVSLADGRVEPIVSLGAGIIDGIRVDRTGNLLVSHWEGLLYRITPSGDVVEILDAWPDRRNVADFEYLPDRNLVIVPTFLDNRVVAYRLR